MIQKTLMIVLAIALAACGQSSTEETQAAQANAAPQEPQSAAGDPCALVADSSTTFDEPVTAHQVKMPNGTNTCEWRRADGRICASVTVFGPGWNEVVDVPRNYGALVTSLGAFGSVQEFPGLGEEARIVDGSMGAQLAFRTTEAAVLVGGSCSSGSITNAALAERVARQIVQHL